LVSLFNAILTRLGLAQALVNINILLQMITSETSRSTTSSTTRSTKTLTSAAFP
jgi:hypothetical protein